MIAMNDELLCGVGVIYWKLVLFALYMLSKT
jgi:hypothetical protein